MRARERQTLYSSKGFRGQDGAHRVRAREQSSKLAGMERVLCVVRDMDDDEATLRNASDNVATPPPWYDLCLYVYRNAVKDSKKGLSRTALTAAATGKTGHSAEVLASRYFKAGQTLAQSQLELSLLDADVTQTAHLAAISALPPEQYAPMLALLLEHGWSVKDTQAAVERVQSVVVNEQSTPRHAHGQLRVSTQFSTPTALRKFRRATQPGHRAHDPAGGVHRLDITHSAPTLPWGAKAAPQPAPSGFSFVWALPPYHKKRHGSEIKQPFHEIFCQKTG